ncbi:(Fe-S)-binding protein [Thiocapsa bogorovii]|uniref:(Fe-S)-binding protein n=1 Tax=Thiocapsa bogorovii TaxID=521689 RepID=UPI001E42B0C7|nr:(Fe-S)-binding protein [Thiocapsa bogorovii]UHD14448.1 (Fe-S)-binding protein [Thiocapsa bogorovii]
MKTSTGDPRSLSQTGAIHELLQLADQCVKCGLCLPHCPTFQQARQEADSPRGRIALIQGWAGGDLAMTATLAGHLDGCLGCLNCQRVCPSEVAYGRILDQANALRTAASPAPWRNLKRLALGVLSSARLMGRFAVLPRLYRCFGLARAVELMRFDRLPALRPYHRMATAMGAVARPIAPLNLEGPEGADCDLFLGCMGSAAEGRAVEATLKVAARLNLRLRIVSPDTCCGAMLRHNGLPAQADAQREACVRIHGDRPLVGLASACVAELRGDPALGDTRELCAFLDGVAWPGSLRIRPDRRRVLVHEPCSHRNQLGGNAAVYRLLGRIPGLAVTPMPPGQGCCGAAGTYLFQHPVMAEALLADLLAPVRLDPPDVIVTTNPGCALHLAAGVREAGLEIAVLHPVELIAAALDPAP